MSDDPILLVRGLFKSFGGVAAVNGMDLSVPRGRITGLIGPNGAGKSTLFHLIAGVIKPNSGSVHLAGQDVTGMASHQICRLGLTRTFQLSREFGRLTVLENLMLAAQQQSGESLLNCLFRSGAVRRDELRIYGRAMEVLDTTRLMQVKDEIASNLSGGQKKLVELARALMTDCPLILLDEPGAGVNPSLMGTLTELIATLNRDHGKTFLIVEHDMGLVGKICDPVVVMTEGRKLTEGGFADIRKDPRVIAAYLGRSAA
jgi:branched-chain amino acid transport system ATP-binding protein